MTDEALRLATRVRRLQEVVAKATAAPTLVEVARVIAEEGVAAIDGKTGAIWLCEDDELVLLHWSGADPGRRSRRVHLHGDSPLALAVRTSTPVWLASRAEYMAAFPRSEDAIQPREHDGEIACACLPLVADGRAIGGLLLAFDRAHAFSDDERAFLSTIARQCAHAMEHLRLLESVRQLYAAETAARRTAETANRAKDEFLAMLAHELRNPLAPIVAALALMELGGGDAARARAVISRQVRHLVRLVDDLLDVSRITRGAIELRRVPVELARAVDHALEIVTPLVHMRGHRVVVEVPQGLVVDADPDRLSQVIANLMSNAAKYSPEAGQITVTARAEGDAAVLVVADRGAGIAPDLLPHVFDMFVQGERSADRSEGGLGLGLAIVKNLVELHGGRVSVASEGPGKGAEFTVRWPRTDATPIAASRPQPVVIPPSRGLRVLVVDDNVDAAVTLGELLRALGHEPIVVHDASSALATARELVPELALVDIGLPVIDGYELARRLLALPSLAGTPLVAVTGYGQDSDRARARAAGFTGHLVKPVGLAELRAMLTALPPRASQ